MRLRLAAAAALLGLSCSLVSLPPTPTATSPAPTPSLRPAATSAATPIPFGVPATPGAAWREDRDQAAALLEAFLPDAAAFPTATRYWIEADVRLDEQAGRASIDGLARIRFTNPLARALDDLVLMLWPNDAQYAAEMTTGAALINGQAVLPESLPDDLGVRLTLIDPLPPGASLDMTIPFRVEAAGVIRAEAPKRLGFAGGAFIAPTFYPLVPRLSPQGEWQSHRAPPGGDTTNSDIAFYDLVLRVPETAVLAATGSEVERRSLGDGRVEVHFASGPVRDVAFAAGRLHPAEARAGEVLVRAWVLEEHAGAAESTARLAARAVEIFEDLLGPYPFDELDVVDAPGAFGGIEYPGLVYIGVVGEPGDDLVVVHEVAHQWFYALIGNDQLEEPWLDEASATYAEVLYLEAIGQPRTATGLLDQFRLILSTAGDSGTPIGLPIAGYASESDYGVLVYLKGALFFEALRSRLGEADFRAFLRDYYDRHRYGFATGASFQQTAESACACELDDLFDLWVFEGGDLRLP